MKKFSPFFHKAIPTEEDCRRMKAELDYYRPRLDKALGEGFLKLFKAVVLEFNERKKLGGENEKISNV